MSKRVARSVSPLPRWTSIVRGQSFVPCCDLCGWVGADRWTEADARKACRDYARTKRHREDAEAVSRANRERLPDAQALGQSGV